MKKIFAALTILTALLISSASYCATIDIGELIDQYKHATDVQRQELEKNYLGKTISGSGVIENVGQYDFFDINTDTGEKYYKVLTQQQETVGKTPYQVVFLYKDKSKVIDMARGEHIEKEGTIINIIDERLEISIWLYEDELTSRDKELFQLK